MTLTLMLLLRRSGTVAPTTGCCHGRSVPEVLPVSTRRVAQNVAFVTTGTRTRAITTSRNIRTYHGRKCREKKYAPSTTSLSSLSTSTLIPRAAVSVAVRVQCYFRYDSNDGDGSQEDTTTTETESLKFYLLIQRGTEPSKGMWSLPGGKVEYQETTFHAAQRELSEETKWSTSDALFTKNNDNNNEDNDDEPKNNHNNQSVSLQWFNETVLTTDAIGDGYHYVIAHYFAQYPTVHIPTNIAVARTDPNQATLAVQQYLPIVVASDDAMDAQWYTISEIIQMERTNMATRGVARVVQRIEACDAAHLLVHEQCGR